MGTEDPAGQVGGVPLLHCQARGKVRVELRGGGELGELGVVGGLAQHEEQQAHPVRHGWLQYSTVQYSTV